MTIVFEQLEYRYPQSSVAALRVDGMEIADGAFCLIAGPSAGGKTTLLRTINGLIPQFHGGTIGGRIGVRGLDPTRTPAREMARIAGMVFQEPEAQGVADIVEEEIAFAMEQHGVPAPEMRRRIDSLVERLAIEGLRKRRLSTLSGGERQRVAIAAVLALQPSILLLDEPTSQLDPVGAGAVIAAVRRLHREQGLNVLIAEHRLERLLPVVDSVIEVRGAARMLSPRAAAEELEAVPAASELGRRFGVRPVPLSVAEAQDALPNGLAVLAREHRAPGEVLIRAEGLTVRFGETIALADAGFELREGEIVALVGANGSGKTTLFRALAGLAEPARGGVRFGRCAAPRSVHQRTAFAAMVPQDPAIALYHDTVAEEVADTLRHRGGAKDEAGSCLADWDVAELAARNPRDLSVGQQQRVAIAAMLPHQPPVWLLDEPTRGADVAARAWLAGRLAEHARGGGAAIVATHDFESAARYATRVIGLEGGRVCFDMAARQAFAAGGPCATQTALLAPGAITPEEVAI